MPHGPRFQLRLLLVSTILAGNTFPQASASAAHGAIPPQTGSASDPKSQEESSSTAVPVEEGELAPAAVQIDVSRSSPLIQVLYQATRETKKQVILDKLDEAKRLLENGTDVKATDDRGRTALHWAVFGSSYNTDSKIIVAYEEIADQLIAKGVDLNKEDTYNDTALDYLLYSPNFEMQTLLIEHGATSGFLAAFFHFYQQASLGPPPAQETGIGLMKRADLLPGQTLSVRLNGPVYSDQSRTGDPLTATVTYPLCKNGEDIACSKGELVVAPGTQVNGTILFAQKAPDKYSRPRIVLDFSNIVNRNGTVSPLYAHVIDVDNARETISNNEIQGIVQPHASTKVSIAMAGLSAVNPIAGCAIKGIQTVYGLSVRREVLFPAGTDLQIQIVRPSMLKEKESWPGWPKMEQDPKLTALVMAAPLRTKTPDNKPSDLTNLMFIGTEEELAVAFSEAGWFEAVGLGVGSALKTVQATIRNTGYNEAPVSLLTLEGRPPDLVFQKSLDTFAKRHHIRIWKLEGLYECRPVWVGAATHDIGVANSRMKTKWSHRIDPHIDRERDWIETDLLFAGTAVAYTDIPRPSAPRKAGNATGDAVVTDGAMTVVKVGALKARSLEAADPSLKSRQ
jgi:LssY C-terminus/Ankyrin repeats (3 copies)